MASSIQRLVFLLRVLISVAERDLEGQTNVEIKPNGVDPGEPLFLTSYLENGQAAEGRRLARVSLADHLGVTSYAGFFTVNKTYNSNQFFWYFPPTEADEEAAPLVIWLQGGPGASSLIGLFVENGPIQAVNDTITKREHHWAASHHLLYVDNPVGAGFSFTEQEAGYCSDEERVGEELYSTLLQFLQLFPELQENELFVAGESYAGKYVPALAYTIHERNLHASLKINLKGLAIGNGLSDPEHQTNYADYLYQLGLIDWNMRKVFKNIENQLLNNIKLKNWSEASENFHETVSLFENFTGFHNHYNFLQSEPYINEDVYVNLIQKNYIRKQIHVGNQTFHLDRTKVHKHLSNDLMKSVAPWISKLLHHYNVLVYNGQLDIIVGYPLTTNYLLHLNFSGAVEYKTASRHIWKVDGEVAGYVKRAGHLQEVLVRNAGHMVPTDQPRWAQDLITRFTHNEPCYTDDVV